MTDVESKLSLADEALERADVMGDRPAEQAREMIRACSALLAAVRLLARIVETRGPAV